MHKQQQRRNPTEWIVQVAKINLGTLEENLCLLVLETAIKKVPPLNLKCS